MKALAARLHAFGNPAEVLVVEDVEVPPVDDDGVLVEMLAAPINPADINVIQGTYGNLPELPATIGNEGIGRVHQIGARVEAITPGQLVRPLRPRCWATWLVLSQRELAVVPDGIDIEQGSMLSVNPPSALGMLTSFVPLTEGDWIAQNAANSGVGRCVIQIAKRLGLRTLNVVRRAELIDELTSLGANIVVTDDCDLRANAANLTGGPLPKLALNAVGGPSALNLANSLGVNGVHVTYGAMSRQPLKIPNSLLIFRGLSFRGFWVQKWQQTLTEDEARRADDFLAGMVRDRSLHVPIAAGYPLVEVRAAVAHAARDHRGGKVLLFFR